MAKQYSVQFFSSFVESLQDVCRNYLNYNQFVEVSGYVCVEIDNMKKERYVLSELLQSSGNVVSESYCTKAFKMAANVRSVQSQMEHKPGRKDCQNVDKSENRSYQGRNNVNHTNLPHSAAGSKAKRKFMDTTEFEEKEYNQNMSLLPKRSMSMSDHENQRFMSSPSTVTDRSLTSCTEYSSDAVHHGKGSSVQERRVTVPQCLSKSNSARVNEDEHPDSVIPSSNLQETAGSDIPTEDEVIDLDQFDDDFDFPGEDSPAGGSGGPWLVPSLSSAGSSQQRKSQLSPGSLVAVNNAVKRFQRFISFKYGEDIDLLATVPEELNKMMLVFFKESRKKDGRELAGVSMKNILSYLELFLRDSGYPYSVSKGQQFQSARDYIKNKMEEAAKSMSQVMSPVNNEDIEILFQANQLGSHNPDTLINTMWFLNSKFLTIRRPAEHFGLKWGDIVLKINKEGNEYLERPINDSFGLKLYASPANPDRCFVNYYKQFRAQRPKLCLDKEAPFYLKPNKSPGDDYWMTPDPISWSMLCSLWRKMVVAARLPLNKRIV